LQVSGKDFTLIVWFNRSATGANHSLIATVQDNSGNFQYGFQIGTGDTLQFLATADGTYTAPNGDLNLSGATAIAVNDWHCGAAIWREGADVKLYLDANEDASDDWPATSTLVSVNNDVYLGIREFVLSNDLNGLMGEAIIYKRALSPVELQNIYLATKWRYR
jgi:hypothetical protein